MAGVDSCRATAVTSVEPPESVAELFGIVDEVVEEMSPSLEALEQSYEAFHPSPVPQRSR